MQAQHKASEALYKNQAEAGARAVHRVHTGAQGARGA